jgi:hypothetical protein
MGKVVEIELALVAKDDATPDQLVPRLGAVTRLKAAADDGQDKTMLVPLASRLIDNCGQAEPPTTRVAFW